MSHRKLLVLMTTLSHMCIVSYSQVPCKKQLGPDDTNQSIKFSVAGRKNLTGHWTTQFRLNKESTTMASNWKVDFELSNNEKGGVHNFHLLGVLTAPPPKPADYELFPGIGYYKFHYEKRYTFTEASSTCAKEGGHLVIINSLEETNAIKTLYARHLGTATGGSFIGYYDPKKNRNFITILGEHLNSTGFINWKSGQPDKVEKEQFCVYIWPDGAWADENCDVKYSFFCEYDLSWSDL